VASCQGQPGASQPRLAVAEDFDEVLRMTAWHHMVAVDMPIGLPSGSKVRFCDVLAREALPSGARSRLFLAPPRATLSASTPAEFQAMHLATRGRKAGLPVWGLVDKLRQVHGVMRPGLQRRIVEFHPELTWQRLTGRALASKHKPDGIDERLAVVNRDLAEPITRETAKGLRPAKIDDVLDAISGLYAAAEAVKVDDLLGFAPTRLPPVAPAMDDFGLRMEIWF